MFALMDPDLESMVEKSRMWSAIIFGLSFFTFFSFWGSKD